AGAGRASPGGGGTWEARRRPSPAVPHSSAGSIEASERSPPAAASRPRSSPRSERPRPAKRSVRRSASSSEAGAWSTRSRSFCRAPSSLSTIPCSTDSPSSKGRAPGVNGGSAAPRALAVRGGGRCTVFGQGSAEEARPSELRHGEEGLHLLVGLPQAGGERPHQRPEHGVGQLLVGEEQLIEAVAL